MYPLKPLQNKDQSFFCWLFPNWLLQMREYSMHCVLGADILNKFIVLFGFHPCINKNVKIPSEHILMRVDSCLLSTSSVLAVHSVLHFGAMLRVCTVGFMRNR